MLTKLQNFREERENGFTLIELLVVILIIGILSAIAIPAFLNQRKSAVDSSLKSDLTNAAKQIETAGLKAGVGGGAVTIAAPAMGKQIVTVTPATGTALTIDTQVSDGNVLAVTGNSAKGYCVAGTNPAGDEAVEGMSYDSLAGGLGKSGGACDAGAVAGPGDETPVLESYTLAAGSAPLSASNGSSLGDVSWNFTRTHLAGGNYTYKIVVDDASISSAGIDYVGMFGPDGGIDVEVALVNGSYEFTSDVYYDAMGGFMGPIQTTDGRTLTL